MNEKVWSEQKIIQIRNGQWEQQRNLQKLKLINYWNITTLQACCNFCPRIIEDIFEVKFPNLKELDISRNQIGSIEKLSSIYLPALEELNISDNHIKQVTGFVKASWPQLKLFIFANNYVCEGSSLTKVFLPNLKRLAIDTYLSKMPNLFDIYFVVKLEAQSLKVLDMKWERIKSIKKLVKNIFTKWSSLKNGVL